VFLRLKVTRSTMRDVFVPLTVSGYVARESFIVERCRDKRVLHLGCIGETNEPLEVRIRAIREGWALHSRLTRVSGRIIGLDSDAVAVDHLRAIGNPEIFAVDAEDLSSSEVAGHGPFEVIVAGDIIEHLSCPGAFLDGARNVLADGGELIITCPNAFGLPNYLRFLAGRFHEGADHVLAFSRFSLSNLLRRHGWSVALLNTAHQERAERIVGPLFRWGRMALTRWPELGGTLVAVAKRSSPEDEA